MNRNVESHFSELPGIDVPRSIFDRSCTHKTSFNVGQLIPFFIDEVLAGDSFNVTTSKVVRLQTLLTPVLDNLYLDTYYFFVPQRLVFNKTKEFYGENTAGAWVPQVTYQLPSISSPSGGFNTGTLADYMGLPVGVQWNATDSKAPIALPFRAYALVANEFFRDENLTDPLNIPLGDSNQTGSNGSSYISDVANGGMPFLVSKYHDYFTSCLPKAQKLDQPVSMKFVADTLFPVGTTSQNHDPIAKFQSGTTYPIYVKDKNGTGPYVSNIAASTPASAVTTQMAGMQQGIGLNYMTPTNLWADASSIGQFTINELRLAVQLQRYYERMARSGSRFTEYLRSFFGVTSPDASLQRPEYLGGNRIQIEVHEVTNTAQSQTDFLGDVGAKSVTSDVHEDFVHSFTEPGYILGLCCARYDHSYAQGLERFWFRKKVEEFYNPVFSQLGEQPVYKAEIYADATTMADDSVFGFQECWADYRYKPDRVSAELRPQASNTLASWHFSDYYQSAPTLSDSWIREDKTNVDRTLAVTSANANQIFMDIYIKNFCTRVMPMYSIPGLLDHH